MNYQKKAALIEKKNANHSSSSNLFHRDNNILSRKPRGRNSRVAANICPKR